jgi:nitrite reductase/ring-hydroxylating ferredoxin subunit
MKSSQNSNSESHFIPVNEQEAHSLQRREFIITALSAVGITLSAGALSATLASCEQDVVKPKTPTGEKVEFVTTNVPELANVGGALKRTIGTSSRKVIIVRSEATQFIVLDEKCSHQGCPVNLPEGDFTNLWCGCHFAEFDLKTGAQVKEPETAGTRGPLIVVPSTFNNTTGVLTITL